MIHNVAAHPSVPQSVCHPDRGRGEMSKFSAAGSINNNSSSAASSAGYQQMAGKGAKPDPIGLRPTEAVVTTNRRWIIGLVIGVVIVAVLAVVAVVYSTGIDKPYQVREDDFHNKIMSRNVEIFLQVHPPLCCEYDLRRTR
jgi:hypothetical protein